MTGKFQTEPNDSEKREDRFTGMPGAKEFPDLEPMQSAEKQMEQHENTIGKMERNVRGVEET
ncbi:hypothetical protein AB1K83_15705 [Sporosarcina sp. 179-K 3D1 HS]|uniref:hypothetical protein n=1 Tax=Sporosarcina sp. 179-K 3D1 HS TaxID=3232169 RepID=UPI0039A21EF5